MSGLVESSEKEKVRSNRAYKPTENLSYRTTAISNFDMMFVRAWDTAGYGGIWRNSNKTYKSSASNFSSAIAAWSIYQEAGDIGCKTKIQMVFNWGKGRFLNELDVMSKNDTVQTFQYGSA